MCETGPLFAAPASCPEGSREIPSLEVQPYAHAVPVMVAIVVTAMEMRVMVPVAVMNPMAAAAIMPMAMSDMTARMHPAMEARVMIVTMPTFVCIGGGSKATTQQQGGDGGDERVANFHDQLLYRVYSLAASIRRPA